MKRFFILAIAFLTLSNCYAQKITKVKMSSNGNTEYFSVSTDDNAIINISTEGNILVYGTEYFSENIANYSRVEKFNGRVDLFDNFSDKSFQGKVKYLGRTAITYYASYESEILRGKVKSIGNLQITYFLEFDDASLKNKIKSIGSSAISYYSSFDNEALRGKLKNIASTTLTYFTSFDDVAFRGKIKSIGQINFSYYPSYDRQFAGAMKTGSYTQNVAGINFFIQ